MNKEYEDVKKFHQAFGHPVANEITLITSERAKKRSAWMLEEINEFLDAVKNNDVVEQADAMIDVIYFALGTLVETGIKPDSLFKIINDFIKLLKNMI